MLIDTITQLVPRPQKPGYFNKNPCICMHMHTKMQKLRYMNKAKIIAAFLAISTITLQSCSISRRIQRNTWQAEEIHRSSFVQDSTIADLMRRLQINRDISITIWSQPDSTGQQYATQTIQIKESVQDSTTVHTEQHRQQQEQTEQTVVIRQTENKETDVNKNSIWKIFLIALCVVVIWGMVRRGKC